MRIGVDACCWSNRRGFGRYTRELLTHMAAAGSGHEFVFVVDRQTAREQEFPDGCRLEVVDTHEQPTRAASAAGSRSVRDVWNMGRAAARSRCDAFFFPAVYSYFPLPSRVPNVVTFHDAIAENHPDLVFGNRRSRWFWNMKVRLALRQADCLLTVSHAARKQILETFGVPPDRVRVIPEAPGERFRPIDEARALREVRARYRLPTHSPLLLYVGGVSPHKNLDGLLHALARLRNSQHPAHPDDWQLVIVGDYRHDSFLGCHRQIVELSRRLGLADRLTFTGFVPDDDLVLLYNAAALLVLPSVCEGFGLPAIEAMACGVPVAASNRGSLPEVVGDGGLLFDPHDRDDMAAAITRVLASPQLGRELGTAGRKRAAQFSWQAAAEQTIDLIEELRGDRARAA